MEDNEQHLTVKPLERTSLLRGKWGNAGQGVIPDNAVVANRVTVVIFHYPLAITT